MDEKKMYIVTSQHSKAANSSTDIYMFKSYENAFKKFNELIENEKCFEIGFINEAFDKNGILRDGYLFEIHIESKETIKYGCWWELTNTLNCYKSLRIRLTIVETSD